MVGFHSFVLVLQRASLFFISNSYDLLLVVYMEWCEINLFLACRTNGNVIELVRSWGLTCSFLLFFPSTVYYDRKIIYTNVNIWSLSVGMSQMTLIAICAANQWHVMLILSSCQDACSCCTLGQWQSRIITCCKQLKGAS